tara:strand:- start:93 stop:566 length:474 start_codon:yes stop_codon:yes gene_type:complete
MTIKFSKRTSVEQVEEGKILQPKFDENGLIPVITIDNNDNQVLMHGYMNREALKLSIETEYAVYWSRSRKKLWKKGEKSGFYQKIKRILVDDDQDCLIIFVKLQGVQASCHVGYKSCFYRQIKKNKGKFSSDLVFNEDKKVFDPEKVYKGLDNPTKL